MNTAQDIFNYTQSHNISMTTEGGKLKINGPETALTDEFLESAKQYKSEILKVLAKEDPELLARVSDVCVGLDMTPEQLIWVLNSKGKEQIISGELSASTLKDYAKQIDEAIQEGVVDLMIERINIL